MKLMFKRRVKVQVESSAGGVRRSRRRLIRTIGALVVLAVLGAGVYGGLQLLKKPSIDIGTGEEVRARVNTLSQDQLVQVSSVYILSAEREKDWAYAKALALSALEKHKDAIKVYETLERTGGIPYYVYLDYALTASRAQDRALAVRAMERAIEALSADGSIDADIKEVVVQRLRVKLSSLKGDG